MNSARHIAREIVNDIIYDLSGREGLEHEWFSIDLDTRIEIAREWMDLVESIVERERAEEEAERL